MWKTLLLIGLPLAGACMGASTDIDFDLDRYKAAVGDGFEKIPQSREIEALLGDSDHFISYNGSLEVGQDWNTEVYFDGRYCLTMQVEVRTDRRFSKIVKVLGEPKFYLEEIARVEVNGDRILARNGQHFQFGPKEWAKVVKAKGDFSVIGIKLKRNQPVQDFDKYAKAMRDPRVQVHPDKRKANGGSEKQDLRGHGRIPPKAEAETDQGWVVAASAWHSADTWWTGGILPKGPSDHNEVGIP